MGAVASCPRRNADPLQEDADAAQGQFRIDGGLPPKNGRLRTTLLNILASGGDERLRIDPATGLNKYNISIAPIEDAIVRSSPTANPVTQDSMEYAEEIVRQLVHEAESGSSEEAIFGNMIRNLREDLRREWNLDEEDISLNLVSSGTDAELLPVMLGVLRAQRAREDEEDERCDMLTIVTAAGELGTNTVMAASGRVCGDVMPVSQLKHLRDYVATGSPRSPRSPRWSIGEKLNFARGGSRSDLTESKLSDNVFRFTGWGKRSEVAEPKQGDNVFPLFGSIPAIEVPLRDEISGSLVTPEGMDGKVAHIVETAAASKQYNTVLLHMVIACKTGHCVPSVNCVLKLVERFPEVVPVVDACQMRGLTALSVRRLINLGFIVMCTGSKFFGGPPFCGAVIFPKKYSDELKDHLSKSVACRSVITNSLLSGYLCATTVSTNWPELTALLQQSPNFGLALRWQMAVRNLNRYNQIPEAKREDLIVNWAVGVRSLIRKSSDCIELLDKTADEAVVDLEAPQNQVYGIGLPRTGSHSMAEAMKLLGMCGMNYCTLTLSRVKHVTPEGQKIIGNFEIDNSLFRTYQKVFEENPLAKFILTTRDAASYKESIARWNEKNQDREDISDLPESTAEFENEVINFFVHRRAAHQLLVVDVFKMADEELWTKLLDFVMPANAGGDRFDPIGADVPFPRAVVQVAGNLTQGKDSEIKKHASDGTSPNDLELLPGQVNTIIPITLKKKVAKNRGYRYERLNLEELKRLHLLLALDCSKLGPQIPGITADEQRVLAKRCFVAQPVSLNLTTWGRAAYLGVLRMALGAVSIIEAVQQGHDANELLEQDRIVLWKLEVLLHNWDMTMQWDALK